MFLEERKEKRVDAGMEKQDEKYTDRGAVMSGQSGFRVSGLCEWAQC